jgi:hypothetical protein
MRNQTLQKLLTDLRAETLRSPNSAHNTQSRDADVTLLQRTQNWLWEDYAWPHLRIERDLPVQAGQRYYTVPEDMVVDRIQCIEFKDGDIWQEVKVGVERAELNTYDSDLDERSWPVLRWKIAEDNLGATEQIELWPIPDRNADPATLDGYIRVTGIRNLRPLVADNDTADLDDRLIVLYAAAESLSESKPQRANLKLSQAKKLDMSLRGGMMPGRKFRMFGIGQPEHEKLLRGPPTVYYRKDSES